MVGCQDQAEVQTGFLYTQTIVTPSPIPTQNSSWPAKPGSHLGSRAGHCYQVLAQYGAAPKTGPV